MHSSSLGMSYSIPFYHAIIFTEGGLEYIILGLLEDYIDLILPDSLVGDEINV